MTVENVAHDWSEVGEENPRIRRAWWFKPFNIENARQYHLEFTLNETSECICN